MEIKGKVGVITGGSSGIGRATSERLAKEGAAIVVADLDEAGGAETVKRIESAGGRAVFVKTDVAKLDDARRMLDTAVSKFGRLDILHNNAGIGVGAPGFPIVEPARWHLVIEIDLQAVILGTGLAAPIMEKQGGVVVGGKENSRELHMPRNRRHAPGPPRTRTGRAARRQELDALEDHPAGGN